MGMAFDPLCVCVCVSRQENLKLREQVSGRTEAAQNESAEAKDEATKEEAVKVKLEAAMTQQVHSAQVTSPQKRSRQASGNFQPPPAVRFHPPRKVTVVVFCLF